MRAADSRWWSGPSTRVAGPRASATATSWARRNCRRGKLRQAVLDVGTEAGLRHRRCDARPLFLVPQRIARRLERGPQRGRSAQCVAIEGLAEMRELALVVGA